MNELNIKVEKKELTKDINNWYNRMAEHISQKPSSLVDQVQHLSVIRHDASEDLNQLQHKAKIIETAEKLQSKYPQINKWTWHPMQTSHPEYADLTGYTDNKVFINVEVTTSLDPVGTIDGRMKKTLLSLDKKKGIKLYIVTTQKMLNRALTKIDKNKLKVAAEII